MKKINPEQICSISIYLKQKTRQFCYKPRKTFWGLETQKEGFYDRFKLTDSYVTEEQVLQENENYYIDAKAVYYKPHIEINMSDQSYSTVFFKDEEELNNYLNIPHFRNKTWITINAD